MVHFDANAMDDDGGFDQVRTADSNMAGKCVSAGEYECMGRCGGGCEAPSGAHLDCLEHDFCSCLAGGDSPDCADEWYDTIDDFALAHAQPDHAACVRR